ncbi:MAG: hypothetical protein ACRD34_00015 [Bryobacteraceae bacterium]
MDPRQTLIDVDQAISDYRYSDAVFLLESYYSWRAAKGFEPRGMPSSQYPGGDSWASWCMHRIAGNLA